MTILKIHILYKFTEGPWGGGNQFLKALRDYFRKEEVYSEKPENADVILFNSHHCLDGVFKVKKRFPNTILIHRIDGPISYVRGRDEIIDELIFLFNALLADGTIFQSGWSMEKNFEIGMCKSPYETIIINAPDSCIFNPDKKMPFDEKKVKLIATSWSSNIRKGFDIYKYLDEHLDSDKYEMTFVGNSPIQFKNIKWIKPIPSQQLAKILKEHDIFIIASRNDPCSNSLIEALHCGLPAVARNDGGHLEIVGKAGEFFEDENDVIAAIEKVAHDYKHYQTRIKLPAFDEIGKKYCEFAKDIYADCLNGNYHPKQVNLLSRVKFKIVRINTLKRGVLNKLSGLVLKR